MRIVHVITRLIRGGADENTVISSNGQARDGHEVHLVCGEAVSPGMLECLHPTVRLHRVPQLTRAIKPIDDIRATIRLIRLFCLLKPDIVHTHTSKAGVLGRVAAKIARVPGIIHGVHILPFLNVSKFEFAMYLVAEKLLAIFTHAFVNVSDGMKDAGVSWGIGPSDRHVVIPSGMDIDKFRQAIPINTAQAASIFDKQIDPKEFKLIVMVAALEPRKRVVEFLDVFANVAKSDSRVHFVVLGEGAEKLNILALPCQFQSRR